MYLMIDTSSQTGEDSSFTQSLLRHCCQRCGYAFSPSLLCTEDGEKIGESAVAEYIIKAERHADPVNTRVLRSLYGLHTYAYTAVKMESLCKE